MAQDTITMDKTFPFVWNKTSLKLVDTERTSLGYKVYNIVRDNGTVLDTTTGHPSESLEKVVENFIANGF
jgi:hypothetical protein